MKFVPSTCANSSSVYSTLGLRIFVPTLLTNIFSPPGKWAATAATRALRPSLVDTSASTPATCSPRSRHARTHGSTSLRAHMKTLAPSEHSSSTVDAPMPAVAPVTSAVAPSRRQRDMAEENKTPGEGERNATKGPTVRGTSRHAGTHATTLHASCPPPTSCAVRDGAACYAERVRSRMQHAWLKRPRDESDAHDWPADKQLRLAGRAFLPAASPAVLAGHATPASLSKARVPGASAALPLRCAAAAAAADAPRLAAPRGAGTIAAGQSEPLAALRRRAWAVPPRGAVAAARHRARVAVNRRARTTAA